MVQPAGPCWRWWPGARYPAPRRRCGRAAGRLGAGESSRVRRRGRRRRPAMPRRSRPNRVRLPRPPCCHAQRRRPGIRRSRRPPPEAGRSVAPAGLTAYVVARRPSSFMPRPPEGDLPCMFDCLADCWCVRVPAGLRRRRLRPAGDARGAGAPALPRRRLHVGDQDGRRHLRLGRQPIEGQTVTLKMDIYQPTSDTVTARPAIVWVHGGSFCCGNKSSPEIVDKASVFAKKGYVTVSIDYRLEPAAAPGRCPWRRASRRSRRRGRTPTRSALEYERRHARSTPRIDIGGSRPARSCAQRRLLAGEPRPGRPPGLLFGGAGRAVDLGGTAGQRADQRRRRPALLFPRTNDNLVPLVGADHRRPGQGRGPARAPAHLGGAATCPTASSACRSSPRRGTSSTPRWTWRTPPADRTPPG